MRPTVFEHDHTITLVMALRKALSGRALAKFRRELTEPEQFRIVQEIQERLKESGFIITRPPGWRPSPSGQQMLVAPGVLPEKPDAVPK